MAPQYTTKDLYYYGGLFGGIILTFGVLGLFGVENYWVKIITGLIVGVGLGYGVQQLLTNEDKG